MPHISNLEGADAQYESITEGGLPI